MEINRGVTYTCRVCASHAKPPPPHYKAPYAAVFRMAYWGARKRGYEFDLSLEQFTHFMQTPICHYCGASVVWAKYSSSQQRWSTAHNLDRKDNAKGYSVDNCVVCCKNCNLTKGDRYSFSEFCLLGPVLRQIRETREAQLKDQSNGT